MDNEIQKKSRDAEMIEFDLRRLLPAILSKIWLIVLVSLLCGMLSLGGTLLLKTPMYKASTMFYVNNKGNFSVGDASIDISSGDISTSKNLVNSYIVILRTRETLNAVIDYADSDRTYGELLSMVSASSVNKTEIFQVTVVSEDPAEAEELANAIAHVIPDRIKHVIVGSNSIVVDHAVRPSSPFTPNYTKNTAVGLLFGLLLSVCAVVLLEILDVAIRDEEDLQSFCSYPILASVPDMTVTSKRGYYRRYYRRGGYYNVDGKANDKNADRNSNKSNNFIGENIGFAASEAYKLLRTKLQYSFADDRNCRVFSVTSALAGEGKSLTGVNLAYSLAQLNKRVLIMDCDMRRPTLAEKLSLDQYPGLSECLTGHADISKIIREFKVSEESPVIHVITAGNTPPNPVELLSSPKMNSVINAVREQYDYVLLDMPPICDVSDALASAKLADGILMVVRQNYGSRTAVLEALHQLEFVNAKLLGVLFNFATDKNVGYSRTRYGYRYGYRYSIRHAYRHGYRYGYYKHNKNTMKRKRNRKQTKQ